MDTCTATGVLGNNQQSLWPQQKPVLPLLRQALGMTSEYWRDYLCADPQVALPYDFNPTLPTQSNKQLTLQLDTETSNKWQQIAQLLEVTPAEMALAAFELFLHRYSQQQQIMIDTKIGNTHVPIYSKYNGAVSFAEFATKSIHRLHKNQQAAHCLPAQKIKSNFIFTTEITNKVNVNYHLAAALNVSNNGLKINFIYATAYFKHSTMKRLIKNFQALILSIITNAAEPIATTNLLCADEKEFLLETVNQTATALPFQGCIHQVFEHQVNVNPHQTALICRDEMLSYSQVNSKANQLAHYLRQYHINNNELVGVCLNRTNQMVITCLAIIKAGGAYVPIDPSMPESRMSHILEDSKTKLLITEESLMNSIPAVNTAGPQIINLDQISNDLANMPTDALDLACQADQLAYCIYTSGSTGKPKGVLIEHKGVINLANAEAKTFQLNSQSRILGFAPYSFDASVWEWYAALLSGATLVVADKLDIMPGEPLLNTLRKYSITVATIPPSIINATPNITASNLKTLVTAGEPCPPTLVKKLSQKLNFYNAYGPTETTVCATIGQTSADREKPTIGKPIANTQVYILDELLQPVPIGVPGELYVSGIGLARGYHNQPELTAERFINHPFEPQQKLYKTGDRVRWLANGEIDYIERIDHQVKIRGHRIELGEIEAQLTSHPSINEATVTVVKDSQENQQLALYYTLRPNCQQPDTQELRSFLSNALPNYMVPQYFKQLDSLPLTHNGKIDKKALPTPQPERYLENAANSSNAEQSIESKISQTLTSLLQTDSIDPDCNFFELGVHSLLLAKACNILNESLSKPLKITDLFTYPTVNKLASHIENSTPAVKKCDIINNRMQRNQKLREQRRRVRNGR